jgi:hypothetical protein
MIARTSFLLIALAAGPALAEVQDPEAVEEAEAPGAEEAPPPQEDEVEPVPEEAEPAPGEAEASGIEGASPQEEGEPGASGEELEAEPGGEEEEPQRRRHALPRQAVVQLGTDFAAHRIDYAEPRAQGLLRYRAPMVLAPAVHAELYPLSRRMQGVASGLGLQVDYALTVGGKLRAAAEGLAYPTRASHWGAGVKLRVEAEPGVALSVEPSLGLRAMSFSVGTSANGGELEGLPELRYRALRAGVAVEIPDAAGLAFFASAAWLYVLPGARLGSEGGLSVRSDWGVEATAGVGLWLSPRTQLRLAGHFTRAEFSFRPEPGQALPAGGALDRQGGFLAALRWGY